MPNPFKQLSDGRRTSSHEIEVWREPATSLSTRTPYSTPLPSPPKRRWAWWEFLILPLAVAVTLYQIIAPWARSQGILKLFVTFLFVWGVFGAVAVNLDSEAGSGLPYGAEYRGVIDEGTLHLDGEYCGTFYGRTPRGGWPLGKLYLHGNYCAAWLPHAIADQLGFDGVADTMRQLYTDVRNEYWYEGTLSLPYFGIGIIFFWTVATLPIWLILVILKALLGNLHISWGDGS